MLFLTTITIPMAGATSLGQISTDVYTILPKSIDRTWEDVDLIYNGVFHDPDMVDEEIELFENAVPELVDIEILGESYQGRNITCIRVTNEEITTAKAKTLIVAHHHGREQVTVETALRFVQRLLNQYGVDATITDYVDTEEIFVIPTLNPDALERVINERDYWLRKNLRPFDNDGDGLYDEDPLDDVDGDGEISRYLEYRRSGPGSNWILQDYWYERIDNDGDGEFNEDEVGLVDLNRNYATYFGQGSSSSDPTAQTYHGTSAFSEPETQAFRDFALQHRFAASYSLHTGINATYMPTDEYDRLTELAQLGVIHDLNEILPSSFNNAVGYAAAESLDETELATFLGGGWDDWMYANRNCIVPMTFEIYHNASADNYDTLEVIFENDTYRLEDWTGIYEYFTPDKEYIDDLWEGLIPSFDYLLDLTPRLQVSPSLTGSTVSLSITLQSTRLGSIDGIEILDEQDQSLTSTSPLGYDDVGTATFTLPEEANLEEGYSVFVGNEYTGFLEVVVTSETPLDPMVFVVIGGIAIVAVVLAVFYRRKQ
ncbi:MAG: hypothetical protein BAJATHORv1_70075 [Candidatus Thorarchaeota archaeon]|nr:MAG: hypothetical protein BAJATHORv1_70075 [Candidatus Thorarchaeota archaeon]